MSDPCCANCNAWLPNKAMNPPSGKPRPGWCRATTPVAIQVPTQGINGPQLGIMGAWPTSNSDQWCRAFELRDEDDERPAAAS
jgi:hypothetical protein